MELETPPPFMEKTFLNFHFDYLNPSLTFHTIPSAVSLLDNLREGFHKKAAVEKEKEDDI